MEFNWYSLVHLVLFTTLSAEVWSTNLPPSFTKDMNNLLLSENTPVGKVIFTLEGTDPENSSVFYGLTGTDLFEVNPNSGEVTVVKPLDHEVNDTLNFFVTIEDVVDGAPVGKNNIVTAPVTVIILEENDNAPVFQNVPYAFTINEDAPVDSTVFSNIAVIDYDTTGDFLEVKCEDLNNFSNVCDIFQIVNIDSAQNKYQGGLILIKELDYRTQQEYNFMLRATDGKLNSTTMVNVNVNDVQNTPPVFTSDLYAEINENAPIDTLVLTVHAEDGDTGMPRKIAYELVQNPMNYFLIDPITGEVRTAKPLDKEAVANSKGLVYLNVVAKELINGNKGNDLSTMSTVEIPVTIKDVNDEPPAFNRQEYNAEVSEDTEIGFILPNLDMSVRDPDDGINSVFSLTLEDISHVFSIEPKIVNGSSSVIIKINNNSLDYEDVNQRKFIVLVIAKELYTEAQLSSTATLTVTVNDANDNAPQFSQYSYSAQVFETATGGTYVTTIVASDRDSGKFGEDGIVYQLLGIGSEKFVVNNRTGVITVADCPTPGVNNCLDYETIQEYSFSYKATDDDGKGQTTITPLKITLLDNNDNAPKFNQKVYNIHIPEGSFKFEPELIMQATDLDRSSHVVYSIVGENSDGLFSIDPDTGKIRITSNRALTYHATPDANTYSIIIQANDGKYTDTAHVQIAVTDINNHAPTFDEMNYLATVPEDADVGTSVAKLKAKDGDFGLNGEMLYQFKKGALNDFEINSETGVVTVASKLDFDRRNTYYIEVEATDRGDVSLQGNTLLTINVNNTNNKPPYFVPTIQKAEIMKDAKIGTIVHTLVAIDPDINISEADVLNFAATEPITAVDKYGKVVLLQDGFKDFFSVDKHTGKVSVSSVLQRDLAAVVNITVLVTDTTAQHVQQGEGKLIITITDINDQPPKFQLPWTVEKPEYYLQLQEELPIGTTIATYTAYDDDSAIAGYSIIPESKYFKINDGTGILQTKERIDYEKMTKVNFTVVAFDSGIPQLNTSVTVFVTILNINDNIPKFSQTSYNVTVFEHEDNDTLITTVYAKDLDTGDYGKVTYRLTGEYSENFRISPENGEIFVANSNFLDHEVLNETVIEVVANDNAPVRLKHSVSVPVRISILDINDNAPKFNQSSYNITVRENISYNPPVPILQVFATDVDEGNHGHINYKIISGNKNDDFLLGTDTGMIFTHKSLLGKTKNYVLEVEARDGAGNGKFTDKTIVNIFVTNSNQHKPIFIIPSSLNTTVEVTQHSAVANYSIMTVTAMDKDIGSNGKITYHLKVNGSNVQENNEFFIDANTGELKIKKFLDREVHDHYELMVVAKDNGTPVWHEEICYLTVKLINTNENIAEFPNSRIENPYLFSVTENSNKNTMVGQVKAHISTNQHSTKIYYYLISGNENNEFHMSKLDGNLYTNKVFDREEKSEYNLLVLANTEPDYYFHVKESNAVLANDSIFDGSVAKIKVTINDINDNAPQFEKTTYYAAINSLANVNRFVINVSATDRDAGVNGSFYYFIKTSNLYKFESNQSSGSVIPSPFNISENGELFTATSLMENNQNRFIIDVKAKEIAEPEREGSTNVFVWIFEPEQLIRIILSRPVKTVLQEKDEILAELSNVTNYLVIIDEVKDHLDKNGRTDSNWSDMYILVVDVSTQEIIPVFDILKIIDGKYDYLKDYYRGVGIENVLPAFALESEDSFDPALSALIALLLVLLVGIITFTVVCCCLRNWSLSTNNLKKKDALINKAVIDDLNTTENPLWIEQKLKIYEEQELSMQVFNEPDQAMLQRKSSRELLTDENAYATIQHPNRRGTAHTATLSLADDVEDYATLSRLPYSSNTLNGSLRGTVNYYESAMGFHGSTFQVPESSEANNEHEYAPYRHSPDNSINHEYVTELI